LAGLCASFSYCNISNEAQTSADQLRVKAGKTDGVVCRQGHSNFLLKRWPCASESGAKRLQPVVLPDLQGKGLCGKEAFSADLIFVSFYQEKEKRPPRP
jgi:hypothetical protein